MQAQAVYGRGRSSVAAVAHDGMSGLFHVYTYLVLASCGKAQLYQRVGSARTECVVICHRKLAFAGIFGRIYLMGGILGQIAADFAFCRLQVAFYHGHITAFENHVVPVVLHGIFGFLILGEHHQPRSVTVEPVNYEEFVARVFAFEVIA